MQQTKLNNRKRIYIVNLKHAVYIINIIKIQLYEYLNIYV